VPPAQHCGRVAQTCSGANVATTKQRRRMEEITALIQHPMPDVERMDFDQADAFLAKSFGDWMSKEYPR